MNVSANNHLASFAQIVKNSTQRFAALPAHVQWDIYSTLKPNHYICQHESQLMAYNALFANQHFAKLIDLFDFDPKNNRAGVGIVISSESNRNSGMGSEALQLVINYAFNQLQLHQLYANIGSKNEISISLFTKFGFQKIGVKKDWNKINNHYEDEMLYQLITFKK
mgnify:CR=1 FL=1